MRKTRLLADNQKPDHKSELPGQHFKAENDEVVDGKLRLIDALKDTIESESNEVHFEQDRQLCRIRKRINGQLDEKRIESATLVADLIQEVQRASSVESNQPNLVAANHGDLAITVKIKEVNHRLDCTYYPTTSGHNLTIKIPGVTRLPETLEQTTLEPSQVQSLRDHFSKNSRGLTLVCGPDANMLQAVYYGLLGDTNCVENKIVSLEHRSARDIPRIIQLSLAGLDHAAQLSQLATQHADKLFIDWQCTRNKVLIKNVLNNYQSATVFICTQDANTAISQLTDYALNERQLATNLSTLIHLDSIRMVCPHCANSHELSGADMQWLENQALGKKSKSVFVYAPGCARCDYSGSQTSTPLLSICKVDGNIRTAIETRNTTAIDKAVQQKLGKNAVAQKIVSLVANGKVSFTEYKSH